MTDDYDSTIFTPAVDSPAFYNMQLEDEYARGGIRKDPAVVDSYYIRKQEAAHQLEQPDEFPEEESAVPPPVTDTLRVLRSIEKEAKISTRRQTPAMINSLASIEKSSSEINKSSAEMNQRAAHPPPGYRELYDYDLAEVMPMVDEIDRLISTFSKQTTRTSPDVVNAMRALEALYNTKTADKPATKAYVGRAIKQAVAAYDAIVDSRSVYTTNMVNAMRKKYRDDVYHTILQDPTDPAFPASLQNLERDVTATRNMLKSWKPATDAAKRKLQDLYDDQYKAYLRAVKQRQIEPTTTSPVEEVVVEDDEDEEVDEEEPEQSGPSGTGRRRPTPRKTSRNAATESIEFDSYDEAIAHLQLLVDQLDLGNTSAALKTRAVRITKWLFEEGQITKAQARQIVELAQ